MITDVDNIKGELEHRRVKRFYARTNKNKFVRQITKHQRREKLLYRIRKRLHALNLRLNAETVPQVTSSTHSASDPHNQTAVSGTAKKKLHRKRPVVSFVEEEPLPSAPPSIHHQISESRRYYDDLSGWLNDNHNDLAITVSYYICLNWTTLTEGLYSLIQDFLPQLKDHLLARVLGQEYSGDEHTFTNADRNTIRFTNNRIYRHKAMRINYTTYDMRQAQDSINPRNNSYIMVLAHEDNTPGTTPHPYWYAHVVGIFHVNVQHVNAASMTLSDSKDMQFLWVRWFGRDPDASTGFKSRRLHRVGFLDANEPGAFGFLDPREVIRVVHLILAFSHGHTLDLLPASSIGRLLKENGVD